MILPVKELRKALDIVGMAVSSSSIVPICECVKIESEGNKVTLTTSDLRNTICHSFDTETKANEIMLPNFKNLSDYIKLLPNEAFVELKAEERMIKDESGREISKQITIHIKCGKAKATIEGEDPANSLNTDLGDVMHEATLPFSLIEDVVKKSLPFSSVDDLSPQFNGVNIQFTTDSITVLASNKHVLTRLMKESGSGSEFEVHISKSLDLIAKIFQGSENITLKISDKKFRAESQKGFVQGSLVEERFPDLAPALDKYAKGERITIDRMDLISEIKKANLFARKELKEIHLGFSKSQLKIATKSDEYGTFYNNDLPCDSVAEMAIHVDGNYLLKALAACDSDDVVLEHFGKNNEPLKVVDGDYTNLISPIMPNFEIIKEAV